MVRFLLLLICCCALSNASAETVLLHERAFWREVIAQKYRLPEDQAALPLALELANFVTSTDPELRDNFGYEILAHWIHRSGKFRQPIWRRCGSFSFRTPKQGWVK